MIVREKSSKGNMIIISLLIFPIIVLFYNIASANRQINYSMSRETIESFTTIFLSIILEAIPFVMLGTLISSGIQIFLSEQFLARAIPKNKLIGLLMAASIGVVFPVCECAIVPIMRRLVKKGLPVDISVTFMLSVPIVNPVVLASTYYAFSDTPYMVLLRGGLGFAGAIIAGCLIGALQGSDNPLKHSSYDHSDQGHCNHHHYHKSHGCGHVHNKKNGVLSQLSGIIEHTSEELYDVGKMLIIGACISSIMQTFMSRDLILSIGQENIYSTVVMMVMAFVLSLCSEADAFIARTFMGQFTTGSIIAFLILGPMIDLKNIFMLGGSFKGSFIIRLVLIISSVCFIFASFVNMFAL